MGEITKNELDASLLKELNASAVHSEELMPHTFVDNGVKYRWGFRTVNGEPQIITEEVTT